METLITWKPYRMTFMIVPSVPSKFILDSHVASPAPGFEAKNSLIIGAEACDHLISWGQALIICDVMKCHKCHML